MLDGLKESWRVLREHEPGRRFQEVHRRRNLSARARAVYTGGGLLLVGAGLATEAVPFVPSNTIVLVGLAVLAHVSARGARAMDRAELKLQPLIRWGLAAWRKLPRPMKWVVSVLWMLLLSAAGFALWRAVR